MKKIKMRKFLEYLEVVILGLLFSLNYILFIVKNKFAPSGITGIATMIQYKYNLSIGYFYLIVNIPLSIFAFFKIEKDFAIKSFIFTVVYSFSYILLPKYIDFSVIQYDAGGTDTVIPVMAGGLIAGFISGRSARLNSSTGGTDIISKYISQKKPLLNFFWVMFVLNAVVAVISFFVYTSVNELGQTVYNFKPVCLCLIYCFASSFVGNIIIKGGNSAYKFIVVTNNPDEIEKEILSKLNRSATKFRGEGAFTKEEKSILICVISKHQIVEFEKILNSYPGSFAVVENVNQIFGNFKK